jgi:galactokinase
MMNAAALVNALVTRGMAASETDGKVSLFTSVLDAHRLLRASAPQHVWWVPGRLEVFGKHTDYAGGRTLVCAVPRGFAVAASPRDDEMVRIVDARRGGERHTVNLLGRPESYSDWRRYVEVTVQRLARNFPERKFGADIVIGSDLPSAAGMSSSSALVVSIATALVRIGLLQKDPAWKNNIRSGLDVASYYACIENGRSFASLAGDSGVGTHGGSEDHTAMLEGRPGHVSAFAFVPPRALGVAAVPDAWRFVIAASDAAARKTGDALEPYNRLSAGAARLLEIWNGESPRAVSLAAALAPGRAAAERLRGLLDKAATPEWPAAWLRDRLDHFIREDARPLDALDAFANADAGRLGELSAGSQADAAILLGNQSPATSALAGSARKEGAFAACSFGAGFGGAVWALVGAPEADAFAQRWHPSAFVMQPGPPVTALFGG